NPAVQSIHENITVFAGNNVSIEFYVSSEPFITSTDITWSFNSALITAASSNKYNFTFDNRILNIQSVDASDAGEYDITVKDNVSATTRLMVLCNLIVHPLSELSLIEWESFTLNCTVKGSVDIISIQWYRSNGSALPDGHIIHTKVTYHIMLTSVLIVPNARVSDSGLYYCVARFTDGTNSSQSNESFVNITGGIRIIYFPQENNSISIIISSLLLFISSPSFRIQCKGSGDITWINPNGEPVTFNNTSTPHQSSNGILNFTQSPTNGELYTCLSDTGASDSVFVTIGNYSP
uniref:Ig-like domain-containing protein n=1 Tax=Amphimedon queenslandica TaxID=400682 RepID=A0A1X7UXG4_AMPQE